MPCCHFISESIWPALLLQHVYAHALSTSFLSWVFLGLVFFGGRGLVVGFCSCLISFWFFVGFLFVWILFGFCCCLFQVLVLFVEGLFVWFDYFKINVHF